MDNKLLNRFLHLITCALLLTAVAINKNDKVAGFSFETDGVRSDSVAKYTSPIVASTAGDTVWLSSKGIADKIIGYAGTTPVKIAIVGNKIAKVIPLENDETPSFFASLEDAGIFDRWTGLSPKDALNAKIDAVSGATYSSTAVIKTVQTTLGRYIDSQPSPWSGIFSWKLIITLLVIVSGVTLPFIFKSRAARYMQLALNVAIIGFWSNSFISLSLIVNSISNGFSLTTGIIPATLLIIGFIFPLFGKPNHYCNHICPLGSLQELAGASCRKKWKMNNSLVKWLNVVRETLWISLLLLMSIGIGFNLMDYEAFSIFMLNQADTAVVIMACVFILLSLFVPRPYCRFVCPTGSVMKFAQSTK